MENNYKGILLLYCICVAFSQNISYGSKTSAKEYADPDNVGIRYCASWKLLDGTPLYSACDPYSFKRCGKDMEFEYDCCPGFERIDDTMSGQSKSPCKKIVSYLDECSSVVEHLGFKEFGNFLRQVTEFNIKVREAFTIFVPLPKDGSSLRNIYSENYEPVRYHITKGRHYADDLYDGMELESIYNGQNLRVSRNNYGSLNIECAEISRANIECKSGLIHIIRNPLVARRNVGDLDKSTVMSLLSSHIETKAFAESLPEKLQLQLNSTDSKALFTVMAPSSQSWKQLSKRFSEDKLQIIAAGHVIQGYKCSSTLFRDSHKFNTVRKTVMKLKCDVDQNKEVRNVFDICGRSRKLTTLDMVASNGVVYVIDGPIISSEVMTIQEIINEPECAKSLRVDKFIDVLKECDIQFEKDKDYTFILPENSAFDWWSNYTQFETEYEIFQNSKDYRCRVAKYHIVPNYGNLKDIQNFSGHTDAHRTHNNDEFLYETTYITKDKHGSKLNFHYSTVNNFDSLPLDGGSIYRTSRINVIPEKNLTDILESTPTASITNNFVNRSNAKEELFKKDPPKNLYLVTTNDGWRDPRSKPGDKNPNKPEFTFYNATPEHIRNYVATNHVPLYLWGGDIGYFENNSVHRFPSSAGVELIFWKDENGVMRIGHDEMPKDTWPKVVQWNLPAQDGIAWLIDGVIKCPTKLCPFVLQDFDTYTFYMAACQKKDLENETNVDVEFAKHPTIISSRHPEHCVVIKQGEVITKKDIFESNPV